MTPKGTMSAGFQTLIRPVVNRRRTSEWVLLLLLILGVPWGIWTLSFFLAGGDLQLVAVDAMMECAILLAISYLGLHGLWGLEWCSIPVLVTIDALLEFICIPAWRFATGDEQVDSVYVQAMFLTLIGLAAFWIGSLAVKKKTSLRFVPEARKTSNRVAFISAAMLVLGTGGKLVMWKLGLYFYIADRSSRESSLSFLPWLTFLGNLLTAALIVSAIEVLGKRSVEPFMKTVFWLSLVFVIGFGVISGMKIEILMPLLYLVLIYGITHGRIPRAAYLFILLPVLIYPFSDAYRNNLRQSTPYPRQLGSVKCFSCSEKRSVKHFTFKW